MAARSAPEREEYYASHQISEEIRSDIESLLAAGENTINAFADRVASAAVKAMLEDAVTPAAPTPPPAPLPHPAAIGRYQVTRLIGRGGMAEVYLARDPMLERDIAVKLIAGELDGEVARRRLVREASASGRLRHPNIVTIFDAGEFDGRPFIAMEYVPGETMRRLIQRRTPLPLRRRLELIEDACAGLAHAHGHGVVHLDIKPDNLIVDETGVLKVLDFGIARVLSGEALATRHVVGTLRYMSPEQIAGEPIDHRSDIFSLGCSLYELLAFLPAYSGSTREIVYRIAVGPVPRLTDVMPDTDPRLDAVVGKAMALEPGERFTDLEEFKAELARLRDELDPAGDRAVTAPDPRLAENSHTFAMAATPFKPPTASASASHATASAAPRRQPLAMAAAAALIVAAGGGAAWVWSNRSPDGPATSETRPVVTESAPAAAAAASPVVTPPVDVAPNVNRSAEDNEIWLRLAKSDREGVLRLLKEAGVRGGPPAAGRLAADVAVVVKDSMLRLRDAANARPGAAASDAYHQAEARLGAANRLQSAGNALGAIPAFWEAGDLYQRAANSGRATASAPVTAPPRDPAEAQGSTLAQILSPQAVTIAPPVAESPAPAPAPAPAATTAARPPAATPPQPPSDSDRVREAIERYRQAFQEREIAQLLQVFPSLPRPDQMRETFKQMARIEIDVRDLDVQVRGDSATARAVLERRMTPNVGRPESFVVPTEFQLRRSGGTWIITETRAPR